MKIQYKHQKFQADAAKVVVDVFAGQPYMRSNYMIDSGINTLKIVTGWSNNLPKNMKSENQISCISSTTVTADELLLRKKVQMQ